MNELTTPTSGNLTAEQQDAYRLDCEIKSEARNIMNGICRIGRCLKEMKDRRLYEQLGCSSLEEYAEQAVGLKGRAAYNYISAYETYGEQGLEKYGQLGITKLSALAQLADSDREELLESGKAEELSTRELQEEIKRLKRQNDQLTFELEEMEEKKQATSVDMEELVNAQNEAADLKETIRELQANAQKHSEALEVEINQLKSELDEERRNKVVSVPAISKEEKEELRRTIEAEQEAYRNEELKNAVAEASAKVKEEYKDRLSDEAKKTALVKEKLKDAEQRISAGVDRINQLNAKLEAAQAENEKLQANAQKTPPSGNKELLKFLMQNIVADFNKAAELVKGFPTEEQESCKAALKKVADAIKTAGDNL